MKTLLISSETMLNLVQNLRFNFPDSLSYWSTNPSPFVSCETLVVIEVPLLCVVFLYLGAQFTLSKFLFLLIPFNNTIGNTYYVCAAFCIDSRIQFCLLAFCCPKLLSTIRSDCVSTNEQIQSHKQQHLSRGNNRRYDKMTATISILDDALFHLSTSVQKCITIEINLEELITIYNVCR